MNTAKLIILSGLPGSGKSTLAESLAEKLSLPLFSVDPIESSIIKSGIKKSFETGLAAYMVAECLAGEQLKRGLSVIIDAVNPVQEAREMWNTLARTYNAQPVIIECTLEKSLHKTRIEARTRNIQGLPEVTWEDVEQRRQTYAPWKEERLVLDTARPHEKCVEQVVDYIHRRSRERER